MDNGIDTKISKTEIEKTSYKNVEPIEAKLYRQDEVEKSEGPQTCCEKVMFFFRNITIEPPIFFFLIANMINMMGSNNLYLEKACRVNLNFSDEICDALRAQDVDASNEYERETQNLVATALTWKTYISASLPTILALFTGAFSDTTGHRKLFLIITTVGQLLSSINSILNVYFMYQLNLQVLIFTSAFIEGITGGWAICLMIAFTYVSAITTEKNRTFRLGLLGFCVSVAFPIGVTISGILLKAIDYYGSFGVTASLQLLSVLYLILVIKDPKRTDEQNKHIARGFWHLIRQFFDLTNIKESVKMVFKKAPNKRRLRLCLLLAVSGAIFGPLYGEMSIMYMLTRYRFGWDELQYSWFHAYNAFTQILGTLVALVIFSKRLGWHDSMLGIISIASKIAAGFVYCFAPNVKTFFIAPAIEFLGGIASLAVKSIITKQVNHHELGKANSMMGLIENLTPLVYVPLYTNVYTATMEVLPGAVFLVGAALILPALAVLMWWFYDYRKHLSQSKTTRV